MRPMQIRSKSSCDLLGLASGEELLMLMAMSNSSMRDQVRRELDRRAFGASSGRAVAPAAWRVGARPLCRAA